MWTRPVGLTLTGVPAGLVCTCGQEVRTSGSCEQLRQDGGSVFWGGGTSTSANLSGARGPVLRLLSTRPPAQQGAPGVSVPRAWTGPDEGLSSRSWPSPGPARLTSSADNGVPGKLRVRDGHRGVTGLPPILVGDNPHLLLPPPPVSLPPPRGGRPHLLSLHPHPPSRVAGQGWWLRAPLSELTRRCPRVPCRDPALTSSIWTLPAPPPVSASLAGSTAFSAV